MGYVFCVGLLYAPLICMLCMLFMNLNCVLLPSPSARRLTNLASCLFSPGDYLKPGEDEIDGLKRQLDARLAPPTGSAQFNSTHGVDNEWEIGDCLAQWWRPNFETFMVRPHFELVLVTAMVTMNTVHGNSTPSSQPI